MSNEGIVLAECALDTLFLAPLALVQMAASGYPLSGHDLLSGLLLGLVCTAFAYMIFVAGMSRIPVQRASILGYLEPMSAPLYALLLLGERPTAVVLAGGALILVAGLLVVAVGTGDNRSLARDDHSSDQWQHVRDERAVMSPAVRDDRALPSADGLGLEPEAAGPACCPAVG